MFGPMELCSNHAACSLLPIYHSGWFCADQRMPKNNFSFSQSEATVFLTVGRMNRRWSCGAPNQANMSSASTTITAPATVASSATHASHPAPATSHEKMPASTSADKITAQSGACLFKTIPPSHNATHDLGLTQHDSAIRLDRPPQRRQ